MFLFFEKITIVAALVLERKKYAADDASLP